VNVDVIIQWFAMGAILL